MNLDIHGLVIACEAPSDGLRDELFRPYRHFVTETGQATVRVEAMPEAFPYSSLPELTARFSTPRNVVYQHGRLKVVDYFGRGVVLHDPDHRAYSIHTRDLNLMREAFYLLVLSLLGEHCDRVGRLRVHALALSRDDRAYLFMMPPGSGKSTLALGMLEQGDASYISDDDPLFDPRLGILPFPRALGIVNPQQIREIPPERIFRVDRMEFGTKYFVDIDHWHDRVERRPLRDSTLVTTRRILNGAPSIAVASKAATFRTLLRDAVLGLGLYQGIEFVVQRSNRELVAKLPVLARRMSLAARLVRRSSCYRLAANRDPEATLQVVASFIGSALRTRQKEPVAG